MEALPTAKPVVANLGIMLFYTALESQGCECTQIEWYPDYEKPAEIAALLDEFL